MSQPDDGAIFGDPIPQFPPISEEDRRVRIGKSIAEIVERFYQERGEQYALTAEDQATISALVGVYFERARQKALGFTLYHDDKHAPGDWTFLLTLQVGKVASLMVLGPIGRQNDAWVIMVMHLRRRAQTLAGVAVAAMEWCDRRLPGQHRTR